MDKDKELREKGYVRDSKFTLEEQINLLRGSPESNSPVKKSPRKSNSPGVTKVLVVGRENTKEEYVLVDTIECRSSKSYPSPNEYASNQVLIPDDEKKEISPGNLPSGGTPVKIDPSCAKKNLFVDDKQDSGASNTLMETSMEALNTPTETSTAQKNDEKPKIPSNEPEKTFAELKTVPIMDCQVFGAHFSLHKKAVATGTLTDQEGAASMDLQTNTSGTLLNLDQPLSMDWNVNLINLDTDVSCSGTDNSQTAGLPNEMYQYKCPYCTESFWKEEDFRQHCRKEHIDMK